MRTQGGPRANTTSRARITVDVAGAFVGGAARFLEELQSWIARSPETAHTVSLIGRDRRLTPYWLLAREFPALSSSMRVALNNASFCLPGSHRTVLLRNALHFCTPEELRGSGFTPSRELVAQIPVIRKLAHRAHRIVVPCHAMAERVLLFEPGLRSRIIVRGHPVSRPTWPVTIPHERKTILVPIVPAPYKNLEYHLSALLAATQDMDLQIRVTATPSQLPSLAGHERVHFLGLLPHPQLLRYWAGARAIYYPTQLEAFGYPLAEARVSGRWIIARDSDQSREIAGASLCAFEEGDAESLRDAVWKTREGDPEPDATSNDPDAYFSWLFEDCLHRDSK